MERKKVIISGGGTGGHIFPALSIANALKEIDSEIEILFVGAEGKMEMERVPAAGYEIIGLPVAGLQRKLSLSNLSLPFKLLKSISKAGKIINRFKPDIAVGVGGYASAPLLWSASKRGIPCLIQEQNSFAGLTNKILGKKASKICVAYSGMERFFPKEKIIYTGNPIRKEMKPFTIEEKRKGYEFYKLKEDLPCVFVVGGSLGCGTLNRVMKKWCLENGKESRYQIIWQSGKGYNQNISEFFSNLPSAEINSDSRVYGNVKNFDFISRMDLAYAAADIIISRAGAGTISELCAAGKASIFVPSPVVAEDHQTHNAMALVEQSAAIMVKDFEAEERLIEVFEGLLFDKEKIKSLEKNILTLAKPNAAQDIAKEVIKAAGWESHPIKNVYFIGIGGIGMSAIARYYNFAGYSVSGYDRTQSKLTSALEKEGIKIHFEENIDFIPKEVNDTLVIYTPAIPQDMKELIYVKERGYRLIKRSLALGEIASSKKCLAISGTHGKTTTSTLLAHILTDSGEGCNAFLGGISKNYSSNLLLSKNNVLVAEADEFDRSFLQLYPEIAVITSMDADHLDIYSNIDSLQEAFIAFASQVKEFLIVKKGLEHHFKKGEQNTTKAKIYTYSYDNPEADFYPSDIVISNDGVVKFTLNLLDIKVKDCVVGIPGWVNVENGVAASAVSFLHGLSPEKIKKGLSTFQGVERRFDIQVKGDKCAYIDDYAHHPKEISAAISTIRNIFPNRKLCGIFQPHLFTRTRDFYKDFAESLSKLDELILLPIYPARESPIEGITSKIILDLVSIENKKIVDKEDLLREIQDRDIDILITFGAGDIDRFILPIKQLIEERVSSTKQIK